MSATRREFLSQAALTAAVAGLGPGISSWVSAAAAEAVRRQAASRPYLELAMKLSNMSRDKLRSVAEDLLDITL